MAAPFDMALPSFLKHLKVLEQANLIVSNKTGRVRTCELRRESLKAAERWFEDQRAVWESRYRNLDSLLTTLKGEKHED
jgi:DNA-binding transcriptional ArsR family regulator